MKYALLCITIPCGVIFVVLGVLILKGQLQVNIHGRENALTKEQDAFKKKTRIIGMGMILAGILIASSPLYMPENMIIQ